MFNVIAIMYIGEITIPNYKGNTSAAALIGSETSRALLGNYDKPTDRQTNGQTGSLGSYTSNTNNQGHGAPKGFPFLHQARMRFATEPLFVDDVRGLDPKKADIPRIFGRRDGLIMAPLVLTCGMSRIYFLGNRFYLEQQK